MRVTDRFECDVKGCGQRGEHGEISSLSTFFGIAHGEGYENLKVRHLCKLHREEFIDNFKAFFGETVEELKVLGDMNKALLLQGMGSNMQEAYEYAYEQFYVNEAVKVEAFCKWVDENIGGCGSANIDILFAAFNNPDDKALQEEAAKVKAEIKEIRSYTK